MTARRGDGRRGFTLVEAMTAVLIVSTLARIAVPNYQEMKLKARAAEVMGDIRAVEVAALNYTGATGRWPADAGPGEVPPELRSFLPSGFTFQRESYVLDWENWTLPDGLPRYPETKVLLGVSISSEDRNLANAVLELVGESRAHLTFGSRYTFVLERM